jgi:hypothetical protein
VVNAYKGIATFQPMYMGLMKVAYRTGLFLSIEARVVYEGEFFEFEMGDDPFIKHRPNAAGTANRNIVAAYMVAKTTNGGVFREVMLKPDLDKVAAVSRAKSGPNKDWPEEMARKAAVRRGWKYLPHTPEMSQVVEHDDANYDLGALDDAPPPPKRINAGFATPQAQAQLTQGADPTMDLSAGLDEALDGDQIPVGGGMSDEEADERAEVSQQLEEQAHLPDINDLPADDDFPGDRPGVKTETSSKPDPLAWARDFTASLPTFLTVRLVNDAWAKAKASGLVAALQAKNLDLFNQLVSLRDDRIDQLQNGLQK